MSDLLSFIAGSLKQKGMTVDEFCKEIGISRQKFYRFVKEPRRFSSDNIRSIIDVLSLSDAEAKVLESHIYPKASADVPSEAGDYAQLIADLLSRRLSDELSMVADHIEYTDPSGTVTMESSESIARIMAGEFTAQTGSDPDARLAHDFKVTIYNCVPTRDDIERKRVRRTDLWIMTITQIIKELDRLLLPISDTKIRVRHYISNRERHKLSLAEKGDKDALTLGLHIFNTVLPLMSLAEDYKLDQAQNLRRFWFDNRDVCLIRHTCRPAEGASRNPVRAGNSPEDGSISYYLLVFTNNGDCYACHLGNEEASHIYRFFSIDNTAKEAQLSEKAHSATPNQIFYQMHSQHRMVLIHSDLCFDDVPPQLWLALYKDVESRSDKALYEQVFRKLIDPFDQYAFLHFQDLVFSAIGTLQQRSHDASRFGKITICHPEGLKNMVRTGMIMDLISDTVDYRGLHWSDSPLRFPAPMIRSLLVMIRDNIALRMASPDADPIRRGETNFFILRPRFPYPEISMVIYDGLGISPLYEDGPHKNTSTNLFNSPAIGTLIYNYMADEVIRKRGASFKSSIMSDGHSIILLDSLIAKLDREAAQSVPETHGDPHAEPHPSDGKPIRKGDRL